MVSPIAFSYQDSEVITPPLDRSSSSIYICLPNTSRGLIVYANQYYVRAGARHGEGRWMFPDSIAIGASDANGHRTKGNARKGETERA